MFVLKDVRALGLGAVPRAAYEASKRTGAHRFLFNTVSGGSAVRAIGAYGTPSIDSAAGRLCIADAHAIVSEGLLAFGRRFPIVTSREWITEPETGRAWPEASWWTIDIRTDRRLGDVKWTWELGRHRDLVVLARAVALEPDGGWLGHLDRLIRWWCEVNPLECSIHWYSNLELALRLFAWDQVLGLAGDRLPHRTLDLMALHITQMRRHLWRDLPYTLSSMRNNHMLGDALGLWLADAMTGHSGSSMRSQVAERMWQSQLTRQVYPDGSMIEDSVSYHRFVLEMLCARHLTGDCSPELRSVIGLSSRYLADLGALDGPIPQYGDWDEGRVLASSSDPLDVGNSVALGLVLSGESIDPAWVDRYDLLAWYAPSATIAKQPRSVSPAVRVGDIAMARRGPWQAWLKCGSGPSHGHADLGHVSVRYRDQWMLVDPGTGTYNGALEVRNGFRVSEAHNVLRPLGEGQIEPHRAFRWMSTPTGRAGRVLEASSATVLWGAHDAYVMRDPSPWPWRIARAVVLTDRAVAVIDWRENDEEQAFELTVPLSGECTWDGESVGLGADRLSLRTAGSTRLAVGEMNPFRGWDSPTYGTWTPAPWVLVTGALSGPVIWSVGDVDVAVDHDAVALEDTHLTVTWSGHEVRMSVRSGDDNFADAVSVEHKS